MDKKMKECFAPHVLLHNLFGLGLGILAVVLVPSLANIWLGVIIVLVALAADVMRKS